MAEIYLAGGCFWGMQKYLASIRGVLSTEVGYANGTTQNPGYEEVCRGDTGHAESVRVRYDPAVLPLRFLLSLYFAAVDPLSHNRQGADVGRQYRTGIYYTEETDRPIIEQAVAELQKRYSRPIAIEVMPLSNYRSILRRSTRFPITGRGRMWAGNTGRAFIIRKKQTGPSSNRRSQNCKNVIAGRLPSK